MFCTDSPFQYNVELVVTALGDWCAVWPTSTLVPGMLHSTVVPQGTGTRILGVYRRHEYGVTPIKEYSDYPSTCTQ
jgi:hypothetical protein